MRMATFLDFRSEPTAQSIGLQVRGHDKGARAVILILSILCLSAASCPPDRVALNTLKSLRTTAEHAVAVVKQGRATTPPIFTDAQELQARVLYSQYLTADKAAAEAIYAGTNLSTENVAKAVNDLVAFVNSLKKGP
jgi:hypothetical protein